MTGIASQLEAHIGERRRCTVEDHWAEGIGCVEVPGILGHTVNLEGEHCKTVVEGYRVGLRHHIVEVDMSLVTGDRIDLEVQSLDADMVERLVMDHMNLGSYHIVEADQEQHIS